MSEYVELKCMTCRKETSLNINRGWDHVESMMLCRREATALAIAASRSERPTYYIFENLPEWICFFGRHPAPEHEVVVESEYGRRPGECIATQGDPDGWVHCILSVGHGGEHDFKRRRTW